MRTILATMLALSFAVPALYAAPSPNEDATRRLYDRVMEEFQNKDYEAALAGFRLFMELHADSSLASSAQYWIGECEFRLARYRDAVVSFDKVLTRYPSSPKLAAATLKKALTYQKLGLENHGRILLERVVVQFPTTQEAELAKKALKGQ